MFSIISSAKSLDFSAPAPLSGDKAEFAQSSQQILEFCQSLSKDELKKLMSISDDLAEVNYLRFATYLNQPEKPAIFAYDGDVYRQIDKTCLNYERAAFIQTHLGILSGLYGLLKPLDYIRSYRLEMAAKFNHRPLAEFWQPIITTWLNQTLQNDQYPYLINLASAEYAAVIDRSLLTVPMINIYFKEHDQGRLKVKALNLKKARGMMIDFVIKNLINDPEHLRQFTAGNYQFNYSESDQFNWVFTR